MWRSSKPTYIASNLKTMKYGLMMFCAVSLFAACSNSGKDELAAPAAPKSAADVVAVIKGKKYKVEKLGILSPFKADSLNPVNWKIQQQDTSKFFREYAAKQMTFTVDFNSDSLATFMDADAGKMVKAVYSVVNDTNPEEKDEKPGIKIKLVYSDSMEFGGGKTAARMTLSMRVLEADAGNILLESNRAYNERPLAMWMKAQ
jgi:hypothetical protein